MFGVGAESIPFNMRCSFWNAGECLFCQMVLVIASNDSQRIRAYLSIACKAIDAATHRTYSRSAGDDSVSSTYCPADRRDTSSNPATISLLSENVYPRLTSLGDRTLALCTQLEFCRGRSIRAGYPTSG